MRTLMHKFHRRLILIAALGLGVGAEAGMVPYTDRAAFLGVLSGPAAIINFDAETAGLIGGQTLMGQPALPAIGVTFPATVPDPVGSAIIQPAVVADNNGSNPTSSPPNSLGTDDAGNYHTFIAGSAFELLFTDNLAAFGLDLISPDGLADGDFRLEAGLAAVSLVVGDRSLLGNFGGADYYSYFLGLRDDTGAGFGSVALRYAANTDGAFLFNLDDLILAPVPTPATLLLVLGGGLSFFARRRHPAR